MSGLALRRALIALGADHLGGLGVDEGLERELHRPESARRTGQIEGRSFDLDFHAIMHFGDDVALETHYVPGAPSARSRC